jgi:hypothetical protein
VSEREFADFIRILKRHRVRFLVIGGYAMAHHGLVRATNDVDVLGDQACLAGELARRRRLRD